MLQSCNEDTEISANHAGQNPPLAGIDASGEQSAASDKLPREQADGGEEEEEGNSPNKKDSPMQGTPPY